MSCNVNAIIMIFICEIWLKIRFALIDRSIGFHHTLVKRMVSFDSSMRHAYFVESNWGISLLLCTHPDNRLLHIRCLQQIRRKKKFFLYWIKLQIGRCVNNTKFLSICSTNVSIEKNKNNKHIPQETMPATSKCWSFRCTMSGPPESPWKNAIVF